MFFLIIFIIVEIFANIWWYEMFECEFEKNEIFKHIPDEQKKELCLQSYEMTYTDTTITGLTSSSYYNINSNGFRGPEILNDTSNDIYQIFIIGGSTVFGSGVYDNQTAPYFLQKKYDESNIDIQVEVINAGIPGATSIEEIIKVKQEILQNNPDLLIVFDGFNDMVYPKKLNAQIWKDGWIKICNIGKQKDFDTIITLQPMLGSGDKILSKQEYVNYVVYNMESFLENYSTYVEQLNELDKHCSKTADLQNIFSSSIEPIYYDRVHTGSKGNEIIADNFYKLSLPFVQNSSYYQSPSEEIIIFDDKSIETSYSDRFSVIMEDTDIFLTSIISKYKTLRFLSFVPTILENQSLKEQSESIQGDTVFFEYFGKQLDYTDLRGYDFSNQILKNINFDNSNLENTDFSNSVLIGSKFRWTDLTSANFEGANLEGISFHEAHLNKTNFKNANLEGTNFHETNLESATGGPFIGCIKQPLCN